MTNKPKSLYSGDEELRNWLASYIRKYPHHTTAILSRSEFIGISRAALDAYLEGTYFSPRRTEAMARLCKLPGLKIQFAIIVCVLKAQKDITWQMSILKRVRTDN